MYTQPIDRHHPGCIVFLAEQSASMNDLFAGTAKSKATVLAQLVNDLIRDLVLQCQRGSEIRDYYTIGIIGYGAVVGPAFGGDLVGQQLVPISRIADYPLRLAAESMPGNPDLTIQRPVWIDPQADGGSPLVAGLDLAGSFLVEWANANIDSFPPIVVNISDGEVTDGDPRSIVSASTVGGVLLPNYLAFLRCVDGVMNRFRVRIST